VLHTWNEPHRAPFNLCCVLPPVALELPMRRQSFRALIETRTSYSTTSAGSDALGLRRTLQTPNSKVSLTICWKAVKANPVRVVGFNTAEGWSRDVSETSPAICASAARIRTASCLSSCTGSNGGVQLGLCLP